MQKILQQLFNKNSLEEISVEELQQITLEFPFFSVAQYLLAKKLKEIDDPGYEKQFQKTLIYFNNPLWLQYQLSAPANSNETIVSRHLEKDEITGAAAFESLHQATDSSPDLIDEVVLHQEVGYSIPETIAEAQEKTFEALSDQQVSTHQEEPAKQTIQREEPFTFQAYYTVDYFASQGIKLSQDNQQQDKLGKQLKSFTEWLKTMRRLPETSVIEILDKINDGEISKIAAYSLEGKVVVTEAMAEVLVKQGKLENARELYHKLSLLNPHKSTYFAAKIEDLKQH